MTNIPLTHCPSFLYGTAWKKDQTCILVQSALKHGFRAFDTAGQPKHYREDLVGEGIRTFIREQNGSDQPPISRSDLYIQTKFTRPTVQDPLDCPYDLEAELEVQVDTSIAKSLENLRWSTPQGTQSEADQYLDAILLHSPFPDDFSKTIRVWCALAKHVPKHIRHLGVSNIDLPVLQQLYEHADLKPSFVQKRFEEKTGYEADMRRWCADKGIRFQAHKVLKGNDRLVETEVVAKVARALGTSHQVAFYTLVGGLEGVTVVNGTKSEMHMREDMDGLRNWEEWVQEETNGVTWREWMHEFSRFVG